MRSVVDSIVEQSVSVIPDENELQDFFQDNLPVFTLDEQYRVVILSSQNLLDIKTAKEIWQESYDIQKLKIDIPSIRQLGIPSGFISKLRLGTLIGPLLRDVVLSLRIGETSKAIETIYGYTIVTLVDKKDKIIPEYSDIKEVVLQEYRRRQRENILEELLSDLRRQSDIDINSTLAD